LRDLPYEVEDGEDTNEPLIFFDTQGGDFPERNEEDDEGGKKKKGLIGGESKSNEMEALLVKMHVGRLVEMGVKEEDIAVITPYNAQVRGFFLFVFALLVCKFAVFCISWLSFYFLEILVSNSFLRFGFALLGS